MIGMQQHAVRSGPGRGGGGIRGGAARRAVLAAMLLLGPVADGAEVRMAGEDPPVRAGEVIDSLADARAFLARHATGPAAREIRRREYWFRVGRRVVEDGEVTRSRRFEYDVAGNLVRRTHEDGDWTRIIHDAHGHPVRELYHESDGRRFGRAEYDYDEYGRLVRERYFTVGREGPDLDIRLVHDSAGRLAREIVVRRDGSRTIKTHTRDTAGRLRYTRSRTLDEDGSVTATGWITFLYGPDGHRTHRFERKYREDARFEAGDRFEARTRYVYDDTGRLIRRLDRRTLNGRWLEQERVYEYDAAGNLVTERVENASGAVLRIEYDYQSRPVDFTAYIEAVH